ncbi:MAG TPA: protein kinase [Pyrinomonadaceae bacterium]
MQKSPRRDPYRLTGELFSGRYRLEEFAGMGSFGAVYRATDTRVGRTVAVKILKPDLGDDETEGARELFQREALTAGRLSHPHIVAVTDVGEESDFAYLVMEWLEGTTLEDELRKRQPFSPEECAALLGPITDALSAAHDSGVIHRDIKPSNIHLGRRERAFIKVLDFGIAKVVTSSTAAAASRIAGTVNYMSPEQIVGSRIDRRSDIYSLGIVLYQMLTGDLPFKGESQGHIIQQHIAEQPPSLAQARPDLPPALSRVIQRALSKLPEARQQTAHELYMEFAAALKSSEAPTQHIHSGQLKTEVLPPPSLPPTVIAHQYAEPPVGQRFEPQPPLQNFRPQQQATIPVSPAVTNNSPPTSGMPFVSGHQPLFAAQYPPVNNRALATLPYFAAGGAILLPLLGILIGRVVAHNWLFTERPKFVFVVIGLIVFGLLFGMTLSGLRRPARVALFVLGGMALLFLLTLVAPSLVGVNWNFDEGHRYRYLLFHNLFVGALLGLTVSVLFSPARRVRGVKPYLLSGATWAIILMLLYYIFQITTYPKTEYGELIEQLSPGDFEQHPTFNIAIRYFFWTKPVGLLVAAALGFIIGAATASLRVSYKENVR